MHSLIKTENASLLSYKMFINDQVFDALNYLVNRSFLVRNLPVISEYALTPKGLNHYSSGRSFEDLYLKEKKSRIALVVSIVSILIALGAIALNIINTSPAIL
jgi:ABC-type oligopeptide transport system substrate-binding subunit